jgi:hypothetical protein
MAFDESIAPEETCSEPEIPNIRRIRYTIIGSITIKPINVPTTKIIIFVFENSCRKTIASLKVAGITILHNMHHVPRAMLKLCQDCVARAGRKSESFKEVGSIT